jgi:hypothetical protein
MMTTAVIAGALFGTSGMVHAGKPGCGTSGGENYCYYTGKVLNSYVNAGNVILMYFDTQFGSTSEINIPNVQTLGACAVSMTGTPAFSKLFYASILTAQAGGRNVSVQMRGTINGTLVCDRVWVEN